MADEKTVKAAKAADAEVEEVPAVEAPVEAPVSVVEAQAQAGEVEPEPVPDVTQHDAAVSAAVFDVEHQDALLVVLDHVRAQLPSGDFVARCAEKVREAL